MRILTLTTNPVVYLDRFYESRPELRSATYATQFRAVMDDCFGWADFWGRGLEPLGHEVWGPIGNAEIMQKQWAREHGVQYTANNWFLEITAAQAGIFQPDAVFVHDYSSYPGEFLRGLSGRTSRRPFVIGWCGAPGATDGFLASCDLVLSCIPSLVEDFRRKGHRSELLHHAFEPSVLGRLHADETPVPVSFVGSIVKGRGYHNAREQFLADVARVVDLEIWADVQMPPLLEQARNWARGRTFDLASLLRALPGGSGLVQRIPTLRDYARLARHPSPAHHVDTAISRRAQPGLYGLEMYSRLRASTVTLNSHIDIASGYASNMRLFEATGVGACLLTEAHANLKDLFEPDAEVAVYTSVEEAIEKIAFLLDNRAARDSIAAAGQRRTLKNHTFGNRASQLDDLIRSAL